MDEEEINGVSVDTLANDIADAHWESNIDGYGDEGAGYDYEKQARILLEKYDITLKPEANHDGH